jgi:hypothetical protein
MELNKKPTENSSIDVGSTGFQGAESVGNSATSIIMEMSFDITVDNTS